MALALRTHAADNDPLAMAIPEDGFVSRLDYGHFGDRPPALLRPAPAQGVVTESAGPAPTLIVARSIVLQSAPVDRPLADSPSLAEAPAGPSPREVAASAWQAPAQGPASAQPTSLGGIFGTGWRLPPYRWYGTLSTAAAFAQTTSAGTTSKMFDLTDTAAFGARSFLVSPTVAPINGSMTLSRSATNSSSTGGDALFGGDKESKSKTTSFGLNLTGTYLPLSPSPTQGSYDYRTTTSSESYSLSSHAFTASKQYQALEGDYLPEGRYLGTLSRTMNYNSGVLSSGYDTLNLNASGLHYRDISLSANAYGTRGLTQNGALPLAYGGAVSAGHRYEVEWTDMTLNTTAVAGANNDGQGSAVYSGRVGTAYSWYPLADIDLQLVGGLGGNYNWITTPTTSTQFGGLDGSVSTSYRLTDEISVSGAGSLGASWVDGKRQLFGSIFVGSGYNKAYTWSKPDVLGFSYLAGAGYGATLGYGAIFNTVQQQGPGQTGLFLTLNGYANQSLNRGYKIDERQDVSASLSESLASSTSGFGTPASTSLVHQATVDYRYLPTANTYLNANATFADYRATGDGLAATTASAGARGGFDWPLTRSSRINGSLSFNASTVLGSSSRSGTTSGNSILWSMAGNLGYFNNRLFGIPRADYSANYGLTMAPESSEPGARLFVTHFLSHRLSYALGKVTMQLTNSFTVISGTKNVTILGTVTRALGG